MTEQDLMRASVRQHMKNSTSDDKPHTGPGDFNEGPQAAARFRAAVAHLAAVPRSAVPRPRPHTRKASRKNEPEEVDPIFPAFD